MVKKINILQQADSSQLHDTAKHNRSHPTEAHNMLWQHLRRRQTGWKFRRQQVIGHFIVDFYCHEAGVVVEVDGNDHEDGEQAALDAERERLLEESGLQVLRFSNDHILLDLESVLAGIAEACTKKDP